jgi:hypothetical protein
MAESPTKPFEHCAYINADDITLFQPPLTGDACTSSALIEAIDRRRGRDLGKRTVGIVQERGRTAVRADHSLGDAIQFRAW